MASSDWSRRSVLRGAGAAVSTGALVSIAGCLDDVPGLAGSGQYTQWLPEPGEIDDDDYRFSYFDTATLSDHEDELDSYTVDVFEEFRQLWLPIDLAWDDTSWVLHWGQAVIAADYDRAAVIDDLIEGGFDAEAEYGGYETFTREDRAIGIGNDTILTTPPNRISPDPIEQIETLVDVGSGDADRYVDEEAEMKALVDGLGSGTIIRGETTVETDEHDPEQGVFEGTVAEGGTTAVDGTTANRRHALVFESEADVDLDDLEEWAAGNDSSFEEFDEFDELEYDQQGRLGIISGTIDIDEV